MDIWLTRFGFGVYIYDNKEVMSFIVLFVCYKWYFFNLLYSSYFDTLIVRLRLINLQFVTILYYTFFGVGIGMQSNTSKII